jgi:putative monooxygenase
LHPPLIFAYICKHRKDTTDDVQLLRPEDEEPNLPPIENERRMTLQPSSVRPRGTEQQITSGLRPEAIISAQTAPLGQYPPQIRVREFASERCGASGVATSIAQFEKHAVLSYHVYPCSQAATVLAGQGIFRAEGRSYDLQPFDCVHFPAGLAHEVVNSSANDPLLVHFAFASASPVRQVVRNTFTAQDRRGAPGQRDPEHIVRFADASKYELAEGATFRDLFAGHMGAQGICGGYGEFIPGSSLPCHVHNYDESITIVSGEALCLVMGRKYRVADYDTALVPQGRPHRFLNQSSERMAMIWVYAGSEPERTVLDSRHCSGELQPPF